MEESLALFRVILSSDYFCNASVILFLNKTDLLPERLTTRPLRYTYPDFDGKFPIESITSYDLFQYLFYIRDL
jgi:hypothetical protein